MDVEVKVDIKPLLDLFGRLQRFDPLMVGAQAGYEFLKDYHSKMDWKGDRYLGAGPNSGQFARDIVEGWQAPVRSGQNTATVVNTDGLLAWKVTGGTISAQNVQYLTIPVVADAKGVPARAYPQKLFRAGNALCIKLGQQVQAIYALKQSVTQQPWPGAMPDDAELEKVFYNAVRSELLRTATGSVREYLGES
jgi:hypothetical protein